MYRRWKAITSMKRNISASSPFYQTISIFHPPLDKSLFNIVWFHSIHTPLTVTLPLPFGSTDLLHWRKTRNKNAISARFVIRNTRMASKKSRSNADEKKGYWVKGGGWNSFHLYLVLKSFGESEVPAIIEHILF